MTIDLTTLSAEELASLSQEIAAELARRSAQPSSPVRVAVTFGAYNARRYSRPWIAKVASWPIGSKPDLAWGGYLGDDSGGEVEIKALPGQIIRYGQKDMRGNHGTNRWAVVEADGTLREVTEAEARQLYAE